jgi:hypothetical protein
VVEIYTRLTRLSIPHSGNQRTILATELGFFFMGPDQKDIAAKAPQDFLAQIAGDLLRAFIPITDLPVMIHHADAGLQALQRSAKNFGVL